MPISEPLARALAAGRTQFNARVAEARHWYPKLEPSAFASFLGTGVDAVVCTVAAVAPDRVPSVVLVAYDIALELVAQGLAGPGARTDGVDRVWQYLAPRLPGLLAQSPAELLAALSNAVLALGKVPNARTEQWLNGMAELASHADTMENLRRLGQIMAWRCGLAHYRSGALAAADQLCEAAALAAVGAHAGAHWATVRAQFEADPWWSPATATQASAGAVGRSIAVGQFTGLGGDFSLPPTIRTCADGFCVRSADRYWLLVADAFGAILLPSDEDEYTQAMPHDTGNAPILQGANLVIGGQLLALDLPAQGLTMAWNAHTVALGSPYTFSIRLFPRPCV